MMVVSELAIVPLGGRVLGQRASSCRVLAWYLAVLGRDLGGLVDRGNFDVRTRRLRRPRLRVGGLDLCFLDVSTLCIQSYLDGLVARLRGVLRLLQVQGLARATLMPLVRQRRVEM